MIHSTILKKYFRSAERRAKILQRRADNLQDLKRIVRRASIAPNVTGQGAEPSRNNN